MGGSRRAVARPRWRATLLYVRHRAQPQAFARQWHSNTPLVVVPTTYPSVRLDHLMSEGIWNFIFANQSIRTVVSALRENQRTLRASADLMSVEGRIASVEELFRLQGADELYRAERKYFDPTRR